MSQDVFYECFWAILFLMPVYESGQHVGVYGKVFMFSALYTPLFSHISEFFPSRKNLLKDRLSGSIIISVSI